VHLTSTVNLNFVKLHSGNITQTPGSARNMLGHRVVGWQLRERYTQTKYAVITRWHAIKNINAYVNAIKKVHRFRALNTIDGDHVSCGCSAGVEQSATTDQGRLLATDISAGDQVSSFPSVI